MFLISEIVGFIRDHRELLDEKVPESYLKAEKFVSVESTKGIIDGLILAGGASDIETLF